MCGIAGLVDRAPPDARELELRTERMAKSLSHRGPDRQGVWCDAREGIGLGHARLSILDLSSLGDQPMPSRGGRYVISFNGEIYGFKELKAELSRLGHAFQGGSDTEVLLAAIEQWGPEGALPRLDGMFAFALWDKQERVLWLARDRMGEKPLYYGWSGKAFLFGSELKALKAWPGFRAEVDREALSLYFRFACVPAPRSIYKGVRKLQPGCYLRLGAGEREPVVRPYWRLDREIERARRAPFEGSDREAIDRLDVLLRKAVGERMVSDVPLGAFLSGGIDSSLIVALMQAQGGEAVRTFTIGYEERDYSEAEHARAVAKHLGTRHSERILVPRDALEAIPRLPGIYDEPFSDPSQLATYLVARHARQEVTVCLSGDAGDELFAGYHRHFLAERLWGRLEPVPAAMRGLTAGLLARVPPRAWKSIAGLSPGGKPEIFADQMRKLIDVLPSADRSELYLRLLSHQRAPGELVLGAREPGSPFEGESPALPIAEEFQYLDSILYLPDDILTKVDRATMAVALEARVPFLAPEALAFAWSLPPRMKIRDGEGKWILRRLLERYLPRELILKPKSGFRVPVGAWMRGELRDWCETWLDEKRLREQGYLDARLVRGLWEEHLSGRQDREFVLWSLLMFQAWLG